MMRLLWEALCLCLCFVAMCEALLALIGWYHPSQTTIEFGALLAIAAALMPSRLTT